MCDDYLLLLRTGLKRLILITGFHPIAYVRKLSLQLCFNAIHPQN